MHAKVSCKFRGLIVPPWGFLWACGQGLLATNDPWAKQGFLEQMNREASDNNNNNNNIYFELRRTSVTGDAFPQENRSVIGRQQQFSNVTHGY